VRDHRAWAHDSVFTNLDPCLDNAVVTNIDILPDVHLLCNFRSVTAFERLGVSRRLEGLYCHPGSDFRVPPNANPGRVMEVAVGTNNNIVGNVQMVAVVAGKRRYNVDVATQVADNIVGVFSRWNPSGRQNGLEKALPCLLGELIRSVGRVVEVLLGPHALVALVDQDPVKGEKGFSGKHLVLFGPVHEGGGWREAHRRLGRGQGSWQWRRARMVLCHMMLLRYDCLGGQDRRRSRSRTAGRDMAHAGSMVVNTRTLLMK
jgi:hypothetical protein